MIDPDVPLIPENGFDIDDFPVITIVTIPYTSNARVRPDPMATIADGWLYIELGNTRIAIPDRGQWSKLVHLIEALWNSHELAQREESTDDGNSADNEGSLQQPVPDLDSARVLHSLASPPEADSPGHVAEPTDRSFGNGH